VDLESGLMLLVFGKQADKQTNSSSGTAASPGSRGHAADGKSLLIQPATGVVVVDADPATHKRVETYLKEIQKRSRRQVQLEARIVEVTLDDGSETGVDWSKAFSRGMTGFGGEFVSGEQALKDMSPTGGILKLTGSFKGLDLNMALKAMARDKNVKVLSTPRISTLNNQKAILRVVQEQPYALISSEVVPGSNGSAPVAVTKMEPLILPVGSMDPNTVGGDFVNPRTFELAGLGCFQLSDRRELLPPLYSGDEVVQFDNEADLVEKIDYYLDHEDERERIAGNARRKTLRSHLYEHRVVEMMEAVQKLPR
jgi:hypothetical protein